MRFSFFHFFLLFALFSCTNNRGAAGTDALYADYSITADEGAENVTCLLKFYRGKQLGDALYLEPPAGVSLDGAALTADSAGLSGTYYEVQKPLNGFAGIHTIVFKNAEGKEYKEEFNFQPFRMADDQLVETLTRGDRSIRLDGLAPVETIRVLVTDTAFSTPDINDVQTVRNGAVSISEAALRNVASGPVTLTLIKEEERPLKNAPARGGKLSITYSLSREFELTDE